MSTRTASRLKFDFKRQSELFLVEPPCQPGAGGTSAALTLGRSPPPTGGRGCKLCSGVRPGPPCPLGAVGGCATLVRFWSPPAEKTVFVKL